jgi:hypothetical protein
MKAAKIVILMGSIVAATVNANQLPFNSLDQDCLDTDSILARTDMLQVGISQPGRLVSDDPSYVEVNQPLTLEAKQNKQFLASTSFPFFTLVNTRDFAFFVKPPSTGALSYERTWSPNEYFTHVYDERGFYSAAVVEIDDERKQTLGNLTRFVPFCEAITVIAHNRPSVSVANVSAGSNISINLNVSLDSLSKAARSGNGNPTIQWRFYNELNGETEFITTSTPNLTFSPTYNGPYQVQATVSDGTLSRTVNMITNMYTGGTNCNTCGPAF